MSWRVQTDHSTINPLLGYGVASFAQNFVLQAANTQGLGMRLVVSEVPIDMTMVKTNSLLGESSHKDSIYGRRSG